METELRMEATAPTIPPEELGKLFEELSHATFRLQSAHETLLEEVDSLRRELATKDRLLERKKRLEALGRVAAGVAHEFRNPLGGMRLTIDALLDDESEPQARTRLERVSLAIAHLDRIVQDLLTFARAGVIEKTRARASEIVAQAAAIAFESGDGPARNVLTSGDPDLHLYVDRHAFTQVLVNLMVNAHQALNGREGRIGVWWGQLNDGRVWLEIADDGPGIPPGDEERVFELFHSRREGGTGLGLAIVHDRVAAHEGEVQVVDELWGTRERWPGARFRIVLPAGSPTHGRG